MSTALWVPPSCIPKPPPPKETDASVIARLRDELEAWHKWSAARGYEFWEHTGDCGSERIGGFCSGDECAVRKKRKRNKKADALIKEAK